MISFQLGQVLPGAILSLSMFSGLAITATPEISEFIEHSEQVTLNHAHSALNSSLKINKLLMSLDPSKKLIIDGREIILKNSYPIAASQELEKLVDFGSQTLLNSSKNTVTIWSTYRSYCFIYKEAEPRKAAEVGDIQPGTSDYCLNNEI